MFDSRMVRGSVMAHALSVVSGKVARYSTEATLGCGADSFGPAGGGFAASEAQQAQIVKHHNKAGKSARWIAEEMTLSRRTVTTVIEKLDGTDRTTAKHRQHSV
jgi:DNA-binding NarL/FixJ family response regulator